MIMQGELFVPDCLFQTDNDFEIPTLDIEMQPKFVDIPFVCFGEQRRTFQMNGQGTLHFYTDDYRFNSVYEHPEKILQHNPANIVEPNFSLFNETPIAFGLQAVYKKRFIAKAMQVRGINVFVDLNVAPKFYKLNLMGIPQGYSSFCTRGYSDRLNQLEFEYEMAKFISNGNSLTFVVYGGGDLCKKWCKSHNAVYVTPVVSIKSKIKSFEMMKREIAFFNDDISIKKCLPSSDDLFKSQIDNYKQNIIDNH